MSKSPANVSGFEGLRCISSEGLFKNNQKGGMPMLPILQETGGLQHNLTPKLTRSGGLNFEVMDTYKDAVYRAALTVTGNFADAEDIMQEVFLQYYRSHPDFESPSHEKAWLLRCTINAARNLLRSAWQRKRVDLDLTELPAAEDADAASSEVLAAVLRLPERYRTAIYLYYYENCSVKEIAHITGRTEAAVGQHLSRGRMKLRKLLGGDKV